jgi:hypothetical protein
MSARYISDQNQVNFQYESGTYAEASGTGHWVGLVTSHDITTSENVNNLRYVGGGTRNVDIYVDGALDHEGSLTYHPQDWKMLIFALGSNTDTGSADPTVPYTHTVSEVNSADGYAFTSGTLCPFASFTIEDNQGGLTAGSNFQRTINGAMLNSFQVSASEGEALECTVDYIGQSLTYASGAATAVTAATTRPFLWQDVKVHIPSGTVYSETKSVSLTINNNIETRHYLNGSRVTGVPVPLNRDYELSLTLDGDSTKTKTLYDQYFVGGSDFNVLLEVTDSSAGAGSRSLFVSMSGCRLSNMTAPTSNEGSNEQEITIMPKSASAVALDTIATYNIF